CRRPVGAGRRLAARPAGVPDASASVPRLELSPPRADRTVLDSVLSGGLLGRRVESDGARVIAALAGVALYVLAAATCLVAPASLNVIITIDSPGANHVVIPAIYWIGVAIAAAALARVRAQPYRRALARTLVIAFATHALLLLAASVTGILDRGQYATPFYWLYARAFYAFAIAVSMAWAVERVRARRAPADASALASIAPAAVTLAIA